MFDNIICEYPLPNPPPDGAALNWQTKSLACVLDDYKIASDGTLWHEAFDTEDQSDPNAVGWRRAMGCCVRVNKRWERVTDFRGAIEFYDSGKDETWWEYSALFDGGKLLNIVRTSPPVAAPPDAEVVRTVL
jgi:hypothetical protein